MYRVLVRSRNHSAVIVRKLKKSTEIWLKCSFEMRRYFSLILILYIDYNLVPIKCLKPSNMFSLDAIGR